MAEDVAIETRMAVASGPTGTSLAEIVSDVPLYDTPMGEAVVLNGSAYDPSVQGVVEIHEVEWVRLNVGGRIVFAKASDLRVASGDLGFAWRPASGDADRPPQE